MREEYDRFLAAGQEGRKLELALRGYFSGTEEAAGPERKAYGAYLKKRIRPAAKLLLEQGKLRELLRLEAEGFWGAKELEEFLKMAEEKGKYAAWIRLLWLKKEKYGFEEKDFSL